MFSVAPNILLAPNMTQNAERKHRTQNTNTAHFRSFHLGDVFHWEPHFSFRDDVRWTVYSSSNSTGQLILKGERKRNVKYVNKCNILKFNESKAVLVILFIFSRIKYHYIEIPVT